MNCEILIAAATSNSGKTTFTMGLLRALKKRGMNVQPYKCGPDYIDTMFHHIASGNESVNLDTFMSSREHVRKLYADYGRGMDCRVVEGVMGMFDGYDKWHGSSAEIAMLLNIPVVLVVNAKSVAYSVAPLIYGFKNFNPSVKIAGVVFNMVASESHYEYLRSACEDAGVKCLGYLARNAEFIVPGRHLGLTVSAKEEMESLIEMVSDEVERHVDIEGIVETVRDKGEREEPFDDSKATETGSDSERKLTDVDLNGKENSSLFGFHFSASPVIAVARDEAFNFTYRANIDALKRVGKMVYFSPLNDAVLPQCDILYLPGGYPELFTKQLSGNESMRESIKAFAENDGKVFAECGGFMYLCSDIDGSAMCDVLPLHATMDNAKLHLGYRIMNECKGHEFHYSSIIEKEMPDTIHVEHCQCSAKGTPVSTKLYHYKNVVAGYTHWYWAERGLFTL